VNDLNDQALSLVWGAATSVGLSVAKWLKLPSFLCPYLNLVLAGGGCFAYLTLHEKRTCEEAIPLAITAVATTWATYKGISQPIGKAIKEDSEIPTGRKTP
jgi:hypothetical protein